MRNIGLLGVSFLLSACIHQTESHLIVEHDTQVLDQRVSRFQETIVIDTEATLQKTLARAAGGKAKASELSLTHIANISAPTYNGITLQATEIRVQGNTAFVSYNVQGETFLGAVDLIDITKPAEPVLSSSLIITNADINGLTIQGNTLYLATASEDVTLQSPAALQVIQLQGLQLTEDHEIIDIASWAATDVDVGGNYLYVTSGAENGALTVLSRSDLSVISETALDDARGVDSEDSHTAVVAGTNARVLVFDNTLNNQAADFSLDGATIPFSKSTVEIKQGKAILGLGDGGMQMVCLDTGEVLSHFPAPQLAELDASLTVTNAATAYKRTVFMANGEAGIYAAVADQNLNANQCETSTLELVGKLQFGNGESVNHITYRADLLFIASGNGGVNIVKVDDSNATADEDDK